ncbi:hypothetical protein Droror1_Dr00012161 [Drosera rotundifolia]
MVSVRKTKEKQIEVLQPLSTTHSPHFSSTLISATLISTLSSSSIVARDSSETIGVRVRDLASGLVRWGDDWDDSRIECATALCFVKKGIEVELGFWERLVWVPLTCGRSVRYRGFGVSGLFEE